MFSCRNRCTYEFLSERLGTLASFSTRGRASSRWNVYSGMICINRIAFVQTVINQHTIPSISMIWYPAPGQNQIFHLQHYSLQDVVALVCRPLDVKACALFWRPFTRRPFSRSALRLLFHTDRQSTACASTCPGSFPFHSAKVISQSTCVQTTPVIGPLFLPRVQLAIQPYGLDSKGIDRYVCCSSGLARAKIIGRTRASRTSGIRIRNGEEDQIGESQNIEENEQDLSDNFLRG
jgi:hypothetical protein